MPARLALLTLLALVPVRSSLAAELTIRLRDASSALPAAGRVGGIGPAGALFAQADPVLHSHRAVGVGPFVWADGELQLSGLDEGLYTLWAQRGPTGLRAQEQIVLGPGGAEVELWLERWVDPAAAGWIAADLHVHPRHDPNSGYPDASAELLHRIARAEDLQLLGALVPRYSEFLSGLALGDARAAVHWGREYRNGWWGHVVLLGLQSDPGPGCCGLYEIGARPLGASIPESGASLALLAHPTTTDAPWVHGTWPSGGYAREFFSLALGSSVAAVAIGSASNGPDSDWEIERYLASLRCGARWSVVGESDATLEQYDLDLPGSVRSYAQLIPPRAPDHPQFFAAWQDAVRAGRCYASDGPVLLEAELDGATLGETLSAIDAQLSLSLRAPAPLRSLRLHGREGLHLQLQWPAGFGPTVWDQQHSLHFAHDDFVVVEALCEGGPEGLRRLVSSPIWVELGVPAPEPLASARAAADELAGFWETAKLVRGFVTPAEEDEAHAVLFPAIAAYESMADDPPGPFQLLQPFAGQTLPSRDVSFRWTRPHSYDGEATSYALWWDEDPTFASPSIADAGADSQLTVSDLPIGTPLYWRVYATESGDAPRASEAPDGVFQVSQNPVAAPSPAQSGLRIRELRREAGAIILQVEARDPCALRLHCFDARGRSVRVGAWRTHDGSSSQLRWDGRDHGGNAVAAGSYWLVVESDRGERARIATVWQRP